MSQLSPNRRSTMSEIAAISPEAELQNLLEAITAVDSVVAEQAAARHLQLTKPPGSLGRIEALGIRLAAMAGTAIPPSPEPAAVAVFAGDHGVHAEGVSPWPQEVTAQMVMNFCAGGAAISVLCAANHIGVRVVNAGVATNLPDHPVLTNSPIRKGSGNLRIEPAMSAEEAISALLLGAATARSLVANGSRCLLTGDMGIANTTPSAAIIAAITGSAAGTVTGRGTGIDDETLSIKTQVVADALERVRKLEQPVVGTELLAQLGGLEIAALAGFCLGGASLGVPVIVDGVISLAGALIAFDLAPSVVDYFIAGHQSVEPGAKVALDHLGLTPLLDLDLRLGEGSGAALAYPLVRAAAAIMTDMATFESAGIGGSEDAS